VQRYLAANGKEPAAPVELRTPVSGDAAEIQRDNRDDVGNITVMTVGNRAVQRYLAANGKEPAASVELRTPVSGDAAEIQRDNGDDVGNMTVMLVAFTVLLAALAFFFKRNLQRAYYQYKISRGVPPVAAGRPHWRETEESVSEAVGSWFSDQVSYKGRNEVGRFTKGSTRPDHVMKPGMLLDGMAIEDKNYDVRDNKGLSSLIKELKRQVLARIGDLPEAFMQLIVVDTRGQHLSAARRAEVEQKVPAGVGLPVENFQFIHD
jgi:hypothetical protein